MKNILIGVLSIFISLAIHSQNKEQDNILYKYIKAHNIGTDSSLKDFIKKVYHPEVYAKINLKDHVAFYNQIVEEFGALNFIIYKKIEETPSKLVAYLIKKEDRINNKFIQPQNILVVEIELSKKNPKYIDKSLGLGSLLCEQKKKE